jgi:hypothetical protein
MRQIVEEQQKKAVSREALVVPKLQLPKEALVVLAAAVRLGRDVFGRNLRSVYGMGSLGYGGYAPGWSDHDVDLIIHEHSGLDAAELNRIAKSRVEAELHGCGFIRADIRAYSVSQLNERAVPFQNGIAARQIMLLDSATLIWGDAVHGEILRPASEQINKELKATAVWLRNTLVAEGGNLPLDDIAAHFALCCRLLYTQRTQQVAGKRTALVSILQDFRDEIPAHLIPWLAWALAVRCEAELRFERRDFKESAVRALSELTAWTEKKLR